MNTFLTLALLVAADDFSGSFVMSYDEEPIFYARPPAADPIAQLQRRLDAGDVKLEFQPGGRGWIDSLLKALQISPTSQTLVFSKTSLQLYRIGPSTPRALYFNDDVYIGFVQNGDVVEISAVDPERGGIFYTLDQRPAEKPKILRRDECLQCHASPKTLGVPGHLVRSVYSDPEGYPMTNIGSFTTDLRSPFHERFGGWYVTGTHGTQTHMGNAFIRDREKPDQLDKKGTLNRTSLRDLVDLDPYLTPHSDIVALTVLAHQSMFHNYVARVNYETRVALHMQAGMNKALGRPEDEWSDSVKRRIDRAVEILTRQVFLADEARLTARVRGTSGFAEQFAKLGPFDRQGRSLRQFDLDRRIFRYPMSFLVYSESFTKLPPVVLEKFQRRVRQVLTSDVAEYSFVSAAEKQALREILDDTRPAWWVPTSELKTDSRIAAK